MNEYCPHCGQSIRSGATFCGHCGKAIEQQQTFSPAPTGAPLTQNKWLLPGAGAALVILAVAAFMLFSGGSDSPRPVDQPVSLAKGVISPAKVAGTADNLASTISTLNKAQLNVMARTTSSTPADPKEIDKGLQDVAAGAMRVAELSNVMSQTAIAQATTPEQAQAAGNLAQQYDAISQTAYGQLIEAQNLRLQLAQGQATLPQITQSISGFGAQMWNTGVTINSRPGNPFEPFLAGTPQVEISINLTPAATQSVTVQLAPNLAGWVAASGTTYVRPITIQLLPAPNFDPLDNDLLLWMLTFDGQAEPYFAQRYALSRLERYRRGLQTDRVGLTGLTGSDWTDVVLTNERANQRYVNMYNLPDWGTVGLNLMLPRGIAVSELAQIQAGIIPSFRGGFGLGYGTPGAAQQLALLGLALNGPDAPSLVSALLMQQAQALGALSIADFKVLGFKPGASGRGTVEVSFGLYAEVPSWAEPVVSCDGAPAIKVTPNQRHEIVATVGTHVDWYPTESCRIGLAPLYTELAGENVTFRFGDETGYIKSSQIRESARDYWEADRKNKLDSRPPLSQPVTQTSTAPAAPKPLDIPPPPPNRLSCPAIKGTQYLSGEETDWYRTNCNTPPPINTGAVVKSNSAAGPVVNSSMPASKAQSSGGAPVAPSGGSSSSSSGVTQPGVVVVIPNNVGTTNSTSGVIQSLQAPARPPSQPAVIPKQPSGNSNNGSSSSNNPNLNGNREDCVAIAASGYYIPGGAEQSWFGSKCPTRDCDTLRTAPFAGQSTYERWYLVNKCPAAPSGGSSSTNSGSAPSGNAGAQKPLPPPVNLDLPGNVLGGGTLGKPLDQGFIWRVCIVGSYTEKLPDGKTNTYSPYQAKMSLRGSDFVGQDGCMDIDTTFVGIPATARVYRTASMSATNTTGSMKMTATPRRP